MLLATGLLLTIFLACASITQYKTFPSMVVEMKYTYDVTSQEGDELVIYTYEYFFGLTGESINSSVYQTIFKKFEEKYNVKIKVMFFSGAKNILLRTVSELKAGSRTADILIGLDNVVIHEAKLQGILEKLDPNNLENLSKIDPNLISWYDPELYGVPYDFGPIALTYDSKRINISSWTFEDFVNKDWDKMLVVESPLTSTTGAAFLLWEIAYYQGLLKEDWRDWWQAVKNDIIITDSWGDAYYGYFIDETKNRPLVISYLTSPVYHYLYENTLRYKSALMSYNGSLWAWSQIQGISIVKNSTKKDIAYKFIDWLLSDEIQSLVAANDIMLPANKWALNNLPDDVRFALGYNLSEIKYLNTIIPPKAIQANISSWLEEWDSTISQTKGSNLMTPLLIGTSLLILIAIVVVVYRKKR